MDELLEAAERAAELATELATEMTTDEDVEWQGVELRDACLTVLHSTTLIIY